MKEANRSKKGDRRLTDDVHVLIEVETDELLRIRVNQTVKMLQILDIDAIDLLQREIGGAVVATGASREFRERQVTCGVSVPLC